MVRAAPLLVLSLMALGALGGCSQAATTVVTSAFASNTSYVDATLDLGHLN